MKYFEVCDFLELYFKKKRKTNKERYGSITINHRSFNVNQETNFLLCDKQRVKCNFFTHDTKQTVSRIKSTIHRNRENREKNNCDIDSE